MFRVLRTVCHLRPSQVFWRLRYAAERRHNLTRGQLSRRWAWSPDEPPPLRSDFPPLPRLPSTNLTSPVRDLSAGIFELLNEKKEIGHDPPDWQLGSCSADRLWTVTLHYHEWAASLAAIVASEAEEAEEAATLLRHYVGDWICRCGLEQPGSAVLAWNSYAVATRLGWWVRAYRTAPRAFDEGLFLRSLWQQACYLNDHLEWDLQGNHLMRDAVGLAWAGRFFAGPKPCAWLRRATDLAVEQVAEQVLGDGAHFERSPKYHIDVMADVLVLALLLEDANKRDVLREAWSRMADYLAWMRHPDGDIPLFNDAGLVGTTAPANLLGLGKKIGVAADASPRQGGRYFPDAGMAVWHGDPWTVFVDVGPVGPDNQPGHAHADTLSIECSFLGRRLFVDPGTFGYDDDTRRAYDRSTEAHNTVCVGGTDSSEMWQIFRVGRRARPHDVSVEIRSNSLRAAASHDGYEHLAGGPRHYREASVEPDGALTLVDRVTGTSHHDVRGGLLVAPVWMVEKTGMGGHLADDHRRVTVAVMSPGRLDRLVEKRPYHPRYGEEHEATRIGWRSQGESLVEVTTVVKAS
jgi:uncharacterized heparinase superfamily protein